MFIPGDMVDFPKTAHFYYNILIDLESYTRVLRDYRSINPVLPWHNYFIPHLQCEARSRKIIIFSHDYFHSNYGINIYRRFPMNTTYSCSLLHSLTITSYSNHKS